ncbi:hypothetical protein MTR67_044181 [Solanum verrucosum]|uniref:Uncharacterized protein n=1 Tax=Solanum verrucosum TaxID=315347 RepID=A0AAF0USV5_SOLVR|nr:hypothetical protein MTR67_044181 [Solanum verrucosum]
MAYAAITCLMSTIPYTNQCNLLDVIYNHSIYEKFESLRAILDKPWKVTVDLEALAGLEAQISQLAYKAQDMVDLESRKVFIANLPISRRIAIWKIRSLLNEK